jgi:hypothetical protein
VAAGGEELLEEHAQVLLVLRDQDARGPTLPQALLRRGVPVTRRRWGREDDPERAPEPHLAVYLDAPPWSRTIP